MILCAMLLCSIAHSIICTRLFRGKMHSDWFDGIDVLQSRWQHGENVGYSYPSGLEKTLCKWDIYVPLVTKGLIVSLNYHFWSKVNGISVCLLKTGCGQNIFLVWLAFIINCRQP